ncbi:phosphotyrosine protein phosphatase [Fertoebacter nigrum]|uniref:Phosphotyrosine protein phosphatase n=1 Tax=Fertoeibacter niger TaxID=2656921 RepID=A0A8X8H7J0_9RHOB|nr:phosphotyrosine protein phosphatase [Fertoeibacter niger]
MKALFICGKARIRSPAAAEIATRLGAKADFAGLSKDADERLSAEQLEWADVICVMEARQAQRLKTLFGPHLRGKRVVVLNIPDRYTCMQDSLVALLEPKIRKALQV